MPEQESTPRRSRRIADLPPEFTMQARSLHTSSQQQPSAAAWNRACTVLGALQLFWLGCVAYGVATHIGSAAHESQAEVAKVQRHLPLSGYDFLLRRWGPLLCLAPFLLRFAGQCLRTGPAGQRQAPDFAILGLVYVGISVLRAAVYILHSKGISLLLYGTLQPHEDFMSDHVFLGAAICAILGLEAAFACLDLSLDDSWRKQGVSSPPFALTALSAGLAVVLYLLTSVDAYYTAVYFHARFETLLAAVLGFICFQGPAVLLLPKEVRTKAQGYLAASYQQALRMLQQQAASSRQS